MNRSHVIRLCLAISGILHFVSAPERFAHASSSMGALFIGLGIFQICLALVGTHSTRTTWLKVVSISGITLLTLFVLNQLLGGQITLFIKEPYSLPTLFRKSGEVLATLFALSLIFHPFQAQNTSPTSSVR